MPPYELNQQIDEILVEETILTGETVKEEMIEEYKQLNEKCDAVITKIKTRKNKKVPCVSEDK